ncbi:hypothetical protein CCACVL1_02494 [Corchorus capsularis]|uniref:F-box domain-containing protein n=1 Tax=Corchorus capsularis TaxID=210143 RepID=A0A1R3K804_COCAP|nr:hypothetical protein CCACVL1_02494 [Corchorus capsularis]
MAGKRKVKKAKIVACSRTYLPDELIIFQILSRLSIESLHGIMRRVCKTWADTIRSPQFARTHLQHAKPGPGLFIQDRKNPDGAGFVQFKHNGEVKITHLNPNQPYPGLILCSCQGLSVFSFRRERYCTSLDRTYNTWDKLLYVANPVMMDVVVQVSTCITPSPNYYNTYGISSLPNNGGFKLVCCQFDPQTIQSDFYILKLGDDHDQYSWRKIGSAFGCLFASDWHRMHVIPIGQYIYWLPNGSLWSDIPCGQGMMIDIANESVSVISFDEATGLQLKDPSSFRGFGNIDNHVALVQHDYAALYVCISKDIYLRNWELYHKVDYQELDFRPSLFVACIDQEVILYGLFRFQRYNMKTKKVRRLEELESYFKYQMCTHTNTLVSPCIL